MAAIRVVDAGTLPKRIDPGRALIRSSSSVPP